MKPRNHALNLLRDQLILECRMFLLYKVGLEKCKKDAADFPAASINIPFYTKQKRLHDRRAKQLKEAILKLCKHYR